MCLSGPWFSINHVPTFQKFTHVKNEELDLPVHYTKNPLWWLGVTLMGFGEVGNFSAYGYAPASVVAPLGTTTVIGTGNINDLLPVDKLLPPL